MKKVYQESLKHLIQLYSVDKFISSLYKKKKDKNDELEKNLLQIIGEVGIYNITNILLQFTEIDIYSRNGTIIIEKMDNKTINYSSIVNKDEEKEKDKNKNKRRFKGKDKEKEKEKSEYSKNI